MKITNVIFNPVFTAGKVQLYSDFDGTYCPAKHSSLHNEGENGFMKEYCLNMDKFLRTTENDVHFHVTTGRTFGEFEAIIHLLKMRGFNLPLPESFIAKNGSDEYLKRGSDKDFYEKGLFPYKYNEPNIIKENEIKNLTNWDGAAIKNFIRDLAKRYSLRFIEADSENSVRDYGNNSLFSDGKLNADEWKKLPSHYGKIAEHKKPIADYVMGARNDGNLKINLIFSPDYGYCTERNYIYDSFMNEIRQYLQEKNVNYDMHWDVPSNKNYFRNHCNITPKIEGGALTKLYDTKNAVKNAVKNNDIVIVAGDGSNDFDMLNPLEYIEKDEWENFKAKSNHKDFYEGNMTQKLYDLDDVLSGYNNELKKDLEANGFLKKIKELPLYSIVIKKEHSKLSLLSDVFGKLGKIVTVNKGELEKGVKEIIEKHANDNCTFKESMSDKLKKYIFGNIKKKDYKKAIIFGVLVLSTLVSIYLTKKYRVEKTHENITDKKE